MADCVKLALEKFSDADKRDIENLYNSMSDARKAAFAEGIANPDSRFAAKAQKILEGYKLMLAQEVVTRKENIKKSAIVENFISNKVFKGKAEGLAALLGATFKKIEGGRLSVGARQKAMRGILHAAFDRKLNDPALRKIFDSGALEREIMVEVEGLAKGGTNQIGDSVEAFKIAQAVHHTNRLRLQQLRQSGAFINDLDGFIMFQAHDAESMKAFGATIDEAKTNWINSILPRLDQEKTFHSDFERVDPIEFLGAAFDDIVNGKSANLQSSSADQLVKIIGTPGNMAKKAALGRKLHFKNANEFFAYNQQFGKRSLAEQFYSSIDTTARSSSMMEVFGTNPMATIEKFQKGMSDTERADIANFVKQVDGTTQRGGHSPVAQAGQAARAITNMASLSLAVLSSFGDTASRALNMNLNGKNFFSAWGETFTSALKNIPAHKQREAMHLTGVFLDSTLGHFHSELSSIDSAPGAASRALHLITKAERGFFGINAIRLWSNANKAGHSQSLAAQLGFHIDKSFADLDPDLGRTLHSYGIGPAEWEALKLVQETHKDVKYVGFGNIDSIPDEALRSILEKSGMLGKDYPLRQISQFRTQTRNKLVTYFNDMTNIAMNEAGVKEHARVLTRGALKDTLGGQAWRSAMQFKSFPVTMVMGSLNMLHERKWVGKTGAERMDAGVNTVAPFIVASLGMGYVGESIREMLKNKTPPDPTSMETFKRAALRSGAGGLAADFMLGEFDSRRGRSVITAAAGPLATKIEDLWDLKSTISAEDKPGGKTKLQKVGAETMRMLVSNVPGNNFPPLKAGLNYLILDDMEKTLGGAEAARNRRVKERTKMKQQGQTPIIGQ